MKIINEERFWKHCNAETKKACGKAALTALVSAVGGFFLYLIAWRDGTGVIPNTLENCIENPDQEEEKEEQS